MAAENVISYDTDTIQSIVNTDLSGLSSLNASTYSDEYLTQDFIAKIFDKLNVGDQSALNKWNTIVTQVNGYITSLEDTPVPEDITQEEQPAQEAANVTVTQEEENPLGDVQTDSAINYETDPRFIPPEALAAGVGIGLGAGIGTNPIDGVQPGDVVGTPGVDYTQKPELPKDVNMDLHVEGERAPVLPKGPGNQPQPEHVQNGDVMDLQGTPGVKPELPKDANMDLHVEGERAPVLPKGPGNQPQPQGQTTTPEVDAVSGAAPVLPEIDAVSGAAPKVNPTEQGTPGLKPELPKDANMDLHVEGERAPVLPKGPGNQQQPQGQTTAPEVDVISDAAPVPPEIDAVSGVAPTVQPTVQTQPTVEPTVEPAKPGIDVTTDPRFQAPKEPEQPTVVPEPPKEPDKTTPKQPETPPKPPVNDKPQQPTIPTFDKTNVFNNLINKLGGNGQQQVSLGMSVCKSYMETNNLTTEQFMMGVNDGSIVLTDPNALSFINALKTTASSDYGTISSTEKLIELLVKLFGILM